MPPANGAPQLPPPPDANTLRIFIATDNHLGFNEKDHIRGNDSFYAFEEVLVNAKEYKSDFLLLGGDLFHDNKPSRQTMVKTMQMFREHCFGDRPVHVEPINVAAVGKGSEKGFVNYEDPNVNICLPVFIIHGNHDDPSGEGNFSALDILSQARMINYFGRQEKIDEIKVTPLLLSKGSARVAVYGLGNIRDERLYQTFADKKVKFMRPMTATPYIMFMQLFGKADEKFVRLRLPRCIGPLVMVKCLMTGDGEAWFSILVIHQNKEARQQKNFIPVTFLPDWLDFVIWGHEHECLIDPRKEKAAGDGDGTVVVVQPGSSVQTALTAAEAVRKHMAYMDIRIPSNADPQYRFKKIPFKKVRPFVYDEITLQNTGCIPTEQDVSALLASKVQEAIDQAKEEFPNVPAPLRQPLVRLKVDHTGFPQIHPRRFGQQFASADKPQEWGVANPYELIGFWRRVKRSGPGPNRSGEEEENGEDLRGSEILEAPEISDLVEEELVKGTQARGGLEVLYKNDLFKAVADFVEKTETRAIARMVEDTLKAVREDFGKDIGDKSNELAAIDNEEALRDKVLQRLQDRQQKQAEALAKANPAAASSSQHASSSLAQSMQRGEASQRPSAANRAADDDNDMPSPRASQPVGGRSARGGRRGAASADGMDAGNSSTQDRNASQRGGKGAAGKGQVKGQMQLNFQPLPMSQQGANGGSSQADEGRSSRPSRRAAVQGQQRRQKHQQMDVDDSDGGDGNAAGSAVPDSAPDSVSSTPQPNGRARKRRAVESDDDEDSQVQVASRRTAPRQGWGATR